MKSRNFVALSVITLIPFITLACSTDESLEENELQETNSVTGVGGTNKTYSNQPPTSVSGIGLSKALKLTLPDSVGGTTNSASSLYLQSPIKAAESCQLAKISYEAFGYLTSMGVTLCHIEAESVNIEFGTKYSMSYPSDGPDDPAYSFGIWVDNSVADKLTVNVCENGKLQQKFTIDESAGGRARGNVQSFSDWTDSAGVSKSLAMSPHLTIGSLT